MNRFLRETWELFYWAMFCPSKLQQRMNEWCPAEEEDGKRPDTSSSDILLFRFNFRFVAQYFLLLIFLSLPLIINIATQGQGIDWLQMPLVLLTSYSASFWFFPIGLPVPFIWLIVYLQQPDFWLTGLSEAQDILPPLSQIAVGLTAGTMCLIISYMLTFWFLQSNGLILSRIIFDLGGIFSILLGSWLASENWFFAIFINLLAVLSLLLGYIGNQQEDNQQKAKTFRFDGELIPLAFAIAGGVVFVVAFIVVSGIMGGIVGVVAGTLAGGVAILIEILVTGGFIVLSFVCLDILTRIAVSETVVDFVAGLITMVGGIVGSVAIGWVFSVPGSIIKSIGTLPMYLSISVYILISLSLASAEENWLSIITAGILTALSFENLGINSLLTIPITLVFYYRLFPDYLLSTPISLFPSLPFIRRFSLKPLQTLKLLPPYTTELLWLPLPNHDRILEAAFSTDVSAAMETFKQMQAFPLPGFQKTIKQALPQIIADQLTTVKTFAELVSIAKPDHPLLPLLVPTFYESDSEAENAPQPEVSPYIKAELSIILPRLQGVARDIEAALEASNAALRERGLEGVLESLTRLSTQLLGLGLKPPEIKRWQPVITEWQRVIELEIEEQQKQSQGEQLNPFQFGNPVRLNRDYLFKGRRKFADDIVRRILNSDRPTLILYGPRRCGKTSFLYNLPRLFPSDVLPVFLDMQSAAITSSEADFCQGLVRAMYKDSKAQGVLLPQPPQRNQFQESPYTVLEDWLDEALEKLEDRQLLLNLDEFEKIGTAISEGQISLKLFDELRHLIQHYDQLGFLFSGVKTLDEIGPNWSSYFISVVPIEMLYLELEEARELLLDPDPEFTLRYDKGIVEEVLKLTRCQPYLLQLLGAAMVTQANDHHTDTINKQLLEAAIKDGFIKGEPYFTNIWTEFTGESKAEILAGQTLLLNLAKEEQPTTAKDDITEAALQYMLRHHILEERDNQYYYEIPLVKMWVQQKVL